MKNVKNVSIMLAIVALISTQYAQSAAPVLEIYNKSKNIIRVTVRSSSGTIDTSISPNNQWAPRQPIDINNNLEIYINDGGRPQAYFYIQAPGKTKYVTWNPLKKPSLYPQTGPLLGFMGKTESGLPLDKETNVKQNQIK